VITIFYGLTSWVAVGAVGAGQVRAVASRELGNMFFALSTQYVTSWVTTVMEVLLCTSILASLVAIHNAASRYMFALGRERILPGWLGASHRRHDSPSRASVEQTLVNVVVVVGFALAGAESLPEPGHDRSRAPPPLRRGKPLPRELTLNARSEQGRSNGKVR
jgi:amino acid transporter